MRNFALLAFCAIGALLLSTTPAAAQPTALVLCTGSATETYAPPLANTTQNTVISFSATYECSGGAPSLTATIEQTTPPVPFSCNELVEVVEGTLTIDWQDETSHADVTVTPLTVGGSVRTLLATGTVASGALQGQSVTLLVPFVGVNLLQCLLGTGTIESMSTLQGTSTLAFG
ncbi:hypothetical protein AB0N62_38510 [Streptomyces sp. NPDC093982]|uniref:hypothetical protein n=1 Tax=Streptomyces sp. NPDC093982 TaxID=3155077 RepID=UPI00343221A2